MSDGSCARTRGWAGESDAFERYTPSSPSPGDIVSWGSDEPERWTDASDVSEVSEKGFERRNSHHTQDEEADKTAEMDIDRQNVRRWEVDSKEAVRKHDHLQTSKDDAKEKKKSQRDQDGRRSYSKERTEKSRRWEYGSDWKDKQYNSLEQDVYRRHEWDDRRHEWDDYSDDGRSQKLHGQYNKGRRHYYKPMGRGVRMKYDRRGKYDTQRGSYRGRSPSRSPRPSSRGSRSPSPCHRDRDHDKEGPSKYKRYQGSGIGGYSPRRRKSDAAVKTPSPPAKSPERKKSRAWDLAPEGVDNNLVAAMAAMQQAAAQQAAAFASVSSFMSVNPAVLTQATRTMRRIYIANVPLGVSDGELLEFLNAAMLSAGANHLPGTKPCLNCLVSAEKNYAFAEFLTPEDATAALAFDGVTLHGTTLKIRRPKDYIPLPTVGTLPVVNMVSNVVLDSPRKVFVGGICKTLSSDKVKEIVTAFGQLKAYHWEVKLKEGNKKEMSAFLEYLDPSVTLKACIGLDGMRLGNSILTVVQATPDAPEEPDPNQVPSYDVPENGKTLLQPLSRILELQNVISEEEVLNMSESELKEIEDDVRLECIRFGTVRSMHVVTFKEEETSQAKDEETAQVIEEVGVSYQEDEKESIQIGTDDESKADLNAGGSNKEDTKSSGEATQSSEQEGQKNECDPCVEVPVLEKTLETSDEPSNETVLGKVQHKEDIHSAAEEASSEDQEQDLLEDLASCEDQEKHLPKDLGKVYVEFTREECCCQAAHAFHGRLYAGRKVVAGFLPLKLYQKRFHKALEPQTHEEKQALVVAALEHLNSYIKD